MLEDNSKPKGKCRIMVNYIGRISGTWSDIMIKGIKKRPHQWYFLITQEDLYGEYDPELYRLDHFCSEKHCYIHHRLCSVNYQGEIIDEELILGDFLCAEEYLARKQQQRAFHWVHIVDWSA